MITSFQALILGAVQGLTEFLPVSSSAHLILVPWLLGWGDPGLAFDVALHLGSLLALLIYYRDQWLAMGASIIRRDAASRRLLILLIVASIPGAIFGLLLEKRAETTFREHFAIIGLTLAVMGVVLWIADVIGRNRKKMDQLYLGDAILIGFSQALAIVPGVSRSGATITMARLLGIERQDAANFSFLMATPIIAGAGLHEMPKILHGGIDAAVIVGFVSSAIFSLVAITALVRFVRAGTYKPFAWYRIAVAIFVIAVAFARA